MRWFSWALLALAGYTLVAPLMRVATSGTNPIPSDVAALMTNTILVAAALAVVLATDQPLAGSLTHEKAPLVYAAGICLAVGILAYYRALALGPVSLVAPVFGLFLVTSSALGIVALGEDLTARKALGIGFAILAVYLVSVE